MTHRLCPLCGRDQTRPVMQKGELRLVRCGHCSMIYANPIAQELVTGAYYDQAGVPFYLSPAKVESDYSPVRFERELKLFRSHCSKGEVLDVGCSTGAFLYQLKTRFPNDYVVTGTDVSGAPLDYAESRGVPVIRGDFLAHDFGNQKFDVISFWAVMEHLSEPKRFLEKAVSILKPGGLCIILVPNMQSLAVRLLGARYRYIFAPHVNYFTRATLQKFVEPHFTVIDYRSMHFNPIVILKDFRAKGTEVPDEERANLLKRTTAYKQKGMLKPVMWLYKATEKLLGAFSLTDNIVVVLRKK
ncbi:class I SAM-dependent methyltransferase [Pedosphaera parvula]|nr:class I SAM-dependent methyltransferase [Pedosphaera parvula]